MTIHGLKRFNLFIGQNNTGKSSILEALKIFGDGGSNTTIKSILEQRGFTITRSKRDDSDNRKEIVSIYSSLITGRSVERFFFNDIEIGSEKDTITLRLCDVNEEYTKDESNNEQSRVRKIIVYDEHDDVSMIGFNPTLLISQNGSLKDIIEFEYQPLRASSIKPLYPSVYVRTSEISSFQNSLMFDSIAMTPLEGVLLDAMRIIEPRIEALNFLENRNNRRYPDIDRIPFVLLSDGRKIQLSTMGDGVNRILTIVLSLLNCKNGFILIDEFENGLHYSVQTELWKLIKKISYDLNIQVFATTHSNDCLKSYIEANRIDDSSVTRLDNESGIITPVPFKNADRLLFAVDNNIEIR